jgi:hypothetical protein
MDHKIPLSCIEKVTAVPTQSKIEKVKNLHIYIRDILGENYHTFLQGSYRNDTAIADINDVDIVAIRKNTYSGQHAPRNCESKVYWETIFQEIEKKLSCPNIYSWTLNNRGDKCIPLETAELSADIVPAVQIQDQPEEDPIAIYSFRSSIEKVNYPRTHYDNGVNKNNSTNQKYKPTVRMFKYWAKNNIDNKDIISSYKMESLVYSVGNEFFSNDFPTNFILVGTRICDKLNSANDVRSVCGTESILDNWDINNKKDFYLKLSSSLLMVAKAIKATNETDAINYWNQAFNI